MPDTYFDLVKQFPLTRIEDDRQLDDAVKVIDTLLQVDLDIGQQKYLEVLSYLVETYEDENVTIPDASEADVLRELMRSNGFNQTSLRKKTGISQSTISAVLGGTRSLTKDQTVLLAKLFGVSPTVFLQE